MLLLVLGFVLPRILMFVLNLVFGFWQRETMHTRQAQGLVLSSL